MMDERKLEIIKKIREASLLAEELEVESLENSEFTSKLDVEITDLFYKLGNRIKLEPKNFKFTPDNIKVQVSLEAILNQLMEYSDLNFDHTLDFEDSGLDIMKLLASAINMMGEELASSVEQLKSKNEALELVSKELEESLEEKEVLLKEVHHRVKNNLQIISGLIQLQANRTNNENTQKVLLESEQRIQAMALVHEKLYLTKNLAWVDITEFTSSLVSLISGIYDTRHEISFSRSFNSEHKLPVEKAITYGLLLNEIISNAYKHAFTENVSGDILISLVEKDNLLNLAITDNGKGIEDIEGIKTKKSLGMKLINSFSKQLGSEVEYFSENGLKVQVGIRTQLL